jgi:hypothetical protein
MDIQAYIDADAAARSEAKAHILRQIEAARLKPPSHLVHNDEEYGVIFEGMTIARYMPWRAPHNYRTALSADRLYMIRQFARLAPTGVVYELGVFSGGVSRMLLDMGREVFAFDTFEGIRGAGPHDLHKDGDYCAAGDVAAYLEGATIVKGTLPNTLIGRWEHPAFVHIDLDVYAPTRESLILLWPRMLPGGIIVLDDFGFWTTPGVRHAAEVFVNDYCAKSVYLPTGQLVIFKDG